MPRTIPSPEVVRVGRQIVIIQGHPDPKGGHFGQALAQAYAAAAEEAGHAVRSITVAELEFPWLRNKADFESGGVPPPIRQAQQAIDWAKHLVVIFPLWHGAMPAILKAFFEQSFRESFALEFHGSGQEPRRLMSGTSARIVVTMTMPALYYRWAFRAHGVKSLERSILRWSGIGPVKTDLIGNIDSPDAARRQRWLERMGELGCRGR